MNSLQNWRINYGLYVYKLSCHLIIECVDSLCVLGSTYWEFGSPLLEIDGSNDITYLHHDRMGSIIATTDDTGAVINSYAYSPWGECSSMSGTTFGFTGQRYDAETGLYFYKHRHYSPAIGRFLQPDPVGYRDGLNMYVYGHNNPNVFTDPMGLNGVRPLTPTDTAVALIVLQAALATARANDPTP